MKENKQKNVLLEISAGFLAFVSCLSMDIQLMTSVGISVTVFSFVQYLTRLGTTTPVMELMNLLCGYQWIVASYFSYKNGDENYTMAVSEDVYMSNTVPFYIAMVLGTRLLSTRITLDKEVLSEFMSHKTTKSIFNILFILGGLSVFFSGSSPFSLRFVLYLFSSFFYVSGLMVIYSNTKFKWYIFSLVFGFLLFKVIRGGVFNEFLSWSFFIIMYLANYFKFSKLKIVTFLCVSIFLISTLQAIKPLYREKIWGDNFSGNRYELFVSLFTDKLLGQTPSKNADDKGDIEGLNSRANQGWVYSLVYKHVPSQEPFAMGETIIDAAKNSLLPRVLFPEKSLTFSADLFTKYTGRGLTKSTAMGLGIPGEAYANFGFQGTVVFMLFYGVLIAWIVGLYYKKCIKYPILFFFVPVYFEIIIRAISTVAQMVNWQVKVAVFLWLVVQLYKQINPRKIGQN